MKWNKNLIKTATFLSKLAFSIFKVSVVMFLLFVILGVFINTVFFGEKVVLEKKSPDGKFTTKEVNSYDEGGLAPYGTELRISEGFFSRDKVFLAGYFGSDLRYEWVDNKNILVKFELLRVTDTVLQEFSVNGITIKYDYLISSPENRKKLVIETAKALLISSHGIKEKFESAKYDAVLLKNGSTQEVVKVCEKGSPTCDKKLQKFKINKPYWKIIASTCKSNPCLGGFFLVYIDDATGEVLYYGGYK